MSCRRQEGSRKDRVVKKRDEEGGKEQHPTLKKKPVSNKQHNLIDLTCQVRSADLFFISYLSTAAKNIYGKG